MIMPNVTLDNELFIITQDLTPCKESMNEKVSIMLVNIGSQHFT